MNGNHHMKILLTGSNGNFGQEFRRATDHQIVQLGRNDWGDLHQRMNGVDTVIHAASDLHTSIVVSPVLSLESNILSSAKLLEAMRECGIKRLMFLSSCAVYGESMRTDESSLCHPTSINGVGKLLNEMILKQFCEQNGIELKILRIFNMYGGDDNFSILHHIQNALKTNSLFNINNKGVAQRDFIHVSDVVNVAHHILNTPSSHMLFNVGTGVSTRISTLVELVANKFPNLRIEHADKYEAEYSRAEISRIQSLSNCKFIQISDFVQSEFSVSGCRNE